MNRRAFIAAIGLLLSAGGSRSEWLVVQEP